MQAPLMISQFQEFIIDVSGSSESAWTILGSALLPSLNSSKVSLSSLFLSIWSNIFSTRFCGVFSSSAFDCWPNVPVHHLKGHHDRSTNPVKRNLGVKIAGLKNLILLTVMLGLWEKYRYSFDKLLLQYCTSLVE